MKLESGKVKPPIPLSTIPESGKGRGESAFRERRAEPTLTEPRFPNNESGIEIRDSGISE
jgi:hypothetical protein